MSIRIYVTGSCDGLETLQHALNEHPDLELVGWSEHVRGGRTGADRRATSSASSTPRARRAARARARGDPGAHAGARRDPRLGRGRRPCSRAPRGGRRRRPAPPAAARQRRLRDPQGGARRPALHAEAATDDRGRIVTVFSPKGGTGKTVTATNLAAALAKDDGKRTLLIDLDLQFGDAAIMLGIEPEKTIHDLVVDAGRARLGEARRLRDPALRPGLDILPAPLRPEDAELVTEVEARGAARGRARGVRRGRRRHLALLPRADAGDARPHGRAAAALRPRRADAEERQAQPAHARPALVPARTGSRSS